MEMSTAIEQVVGGRDLSRDEMTAVMRMVMTGAATDAQIGGFMIGLRMKGEAIDEIVAAATVMRELATPVQVEIENLVDTCGTGGSGKNKFNVSTASAFVAAAAGARVAKHGNRSVSSNSGSADLLEAAGANIMLSAQQVERCIDLVGLGFMFALNHHSAMKFAIGPRKEMKVRTLFNLLGPLTNPAGAKRQLLGVFDKCWLRPIAEVLKAMGSKHAMVVHSEDGLDEISISAKTYIAELKDNEIHEYEISPDEFGLKKSSLQELVITSSKESLELVNQALSDSHEGASNIVVLNAGAAIYLSGQCGDLKAGVEMAQDAIGSGLAQEKMRDFVDFTCQIAEGV
ncbi:MAG: anthranilate phosphoribosyltransferase [Pseudomonadales bacterium]|nr:anthranilate phosphoribosyltransferase [Pseudomonadales bacterium]